MLPGLAGVRAILPVPEALLKVAEPVLVEAVPSVSELLPCIVTVPVKLAALLIV